MAAPSTRARSKISPKQSLLRDFFRKSEGEWQSQRRYYQLKQENEPQEVISWLKINFLEGDEPELIELGHLHQLDSNFRFVCGTKVTWESNYVNRANSVSRGSTVFGASAHILYRDRGFANVRPVTASFEFANPQTICLCTKYNGSVFEEEIKLIGDNYRTRQTIISKAGAELTIGQYLETRIK